MRRQFDICRTSLMFLDVPINAKCGQTARPDAGPDGVFLSSPGSPTSLALHIDDMCLEELVESVLTISPPETAPPPSCVESLHGFEVLAVDVSLTKANVLARLQRDIQIPSVNGRGQPIVGIIRKGNRLLQVAEFNHRYHRPKNLLAHDVHTLCTLGEHSWFVVVASLPLPALAAGAKRSPGSQRASDESLTFLKAASLISGP